MKFNKLLLVLLLSIPFTLVAQLPNTKPAQIFTNYVWVNGFFRAEKGFLTSKQDTLNKPTKPALIFFSGDTSWYTWDTRKFTKIGTGSGGVGGAGTVTGFSVVTANGISASVANPTTAPAATFTLGAITPVSVAASGNITGANLSGTNTGDQTTVTGNAGTATKLITARTIAITGDITYTSAVFDGSANVSGVATLPNVNSSVGSFTNANITVNAKGQITAAGNGSSGSGATNLTVTQGVTTVTVNSSSGTTQAIQKADSTKAGVLDTTLYRYMAGLKAGTVLDTLPVSNDFYAGPTLKIRKVSVLADGDTSIPNADVIFDAMVLKAPLGSPAFTGSPTAPTAAAGTNTTQLATTAGIVAERAATATLTNKVINGSNNTLSNLGTLTYTPSSTTGSIALSTGTAAASIPLATGTNSGLMPPALFTSASLPVIYFKNVAGTADSLLTVVGDTVFVNRLFNKSVTLTGNSIAYTVATDVKTVFVNSTGTAIVTLHSAATIAGKRITIKNIASTTVTIANGSSNDQSSLAAYGALTFESDGTTWYAVSKY